MALAARHRMSLAGMRVLVVDDAAEVRDALQYLLRSENADVVVSSNAEDALAIAGDQDFDVVLVDLGLPDLPGELLIRRVLESARMRPRVIVITAYPENRQNAAWEAGADVVLTKPFEWAVLQSAMRVSARQAHPRPGSTAA